MMSYTAKVQIYRQPRTGQPPDETIEFAFVSAAREYARNQVQDGKAKVAVVANPAGEELATFPQ